MQGMPSGYGYYGLRNYIANEKSKAGEPLGDYANYVPKGAVLPGPQGALPGAGPPQIGASPPQGGPGMSPLGALGPGPAMDAQTPGPPNPGQPNPAVPPAVNRLTANPAPVATSSGIQALLRLLGNNKASGRAMGGRAGPMAGAMGNQGR